MEFDFSDVLADSALPEGSYNVVIEDIVLKDTKDFTGKYFNVSFRIFDGQFKSKMIFMMYNYTNKNPDASKIGKGQFKAMYQSAGIESNSITIDQLRGKKLTVKTKNKTDSFGEKVTISSYKKYLSNDATLPEDAPF